MRDIRNFIRHFESLGEDCRDLRTIFCFAAAPSPRLIYRTKQRELFKYRIFAENHSSSIFYKVVNLGYVIAAVFLGKIPLPLAESQ